MRTCDHPRLACDTSRATEDTDDSVAVLSMGYTRDLWNTRAYDYLSINVHALSIYYCYSVCINMYSV